SYRDHSFIHIRMDINDNEILFSCSNSVAKKSEDTSDSGIGLENIKKRLALLFPQKHQLTLKETDVLFHAELKINLNNSV
ncbi:MAG TPA: histidine kinase, partial [Bacteroidales bacterium]